MIFCPKNKLSSNVSYFFYTFPYDRGIFFVNYSHIFCLSTLIITKTLSLPHPWNGCPHTAFHTFLTSECLTQHTNNLLCIILAQIPGLRRCIVVVYNRSSFRQSFNIQAPQFCDNQYQVPSVQICNVCTILCISELQNQLLWTSKK